MRKFFESQLELGATPIEAVKFNPGSRDDIPQLLQGLQHIYINTPVRNAVLELLANEIDRDVDFNNGRVDMDLWVLLVLGIIRLGLNCDDDRQLELANEHKTLRVMLGHGDGEDVRQYALQTLRDNVALLNEDLTDAD